MNGLFSRMLGVLGMLRVGITVRIAVAVQTLGAFWAVKFMLLTGTETEGNQDRE